MRLSRSLAVVLVLAIVGCEKKKESAGKVMYYDVAGGAGEIVASPFSCGEEVVRDEGLGRLRIGASVDSVATNCRLLRDMMLTESEGMPSRKLVVLFSRDTVEAEIVNNRIWRVSVASPLYRTVDSLGVGTPLSRLLQLKNPRGMIGEGKVFVASPEHCGMSFRLANAGPGAQRGDLDRAGLARLPKSTVVSQILIFGCNRPPARPDSGRTSPLPRI